jgi:RloB-like protein
MKKKKQKPAKPILSKKHLAKVEEINRKKGVRGLEKRYLIVCEDSVSAPNYFRSLKKIFRLSSTSITVVGSDHASQPQQVVNKAIDLKRDAEKNSVEEDPYDQVWCVIDGEHGPKIPNARHSAIANQIRLAVTTMCFEYWILLHFEESSRSKPDCQGVIADLKHNHLSDYEKGNTSFDPIVKLVKVAAQRARKLRSIGKPIHVYPEDHNPCSELYLLIDSIFDPHE